MAASMLEVAQQGRMLFGLHYLMRSPWRIVESRLIEKQILLGIPVAVVYLPSKTLRPWQPILELFAFVRRTFVRSAFMRWTFVRSAEKRVGEFSHFRQRLVREISNKKTKCEDGNWAAHK